VQPFSPLAENGEQRPACPWDRDPPTPDPEAQADHNHETSIAELVTRLGGTIAD